jgi:hypothetical protein
MKHLPGYIILIWLAAVITLRAMISCIYKPWQHYTLIAADNTTRDMVNGREPPAYYLDTGDQRSPRHYRSTADGGKLTQHFFSLINFKNCLQ